MFHKTGNSLKFFELNVLFKSYSSFKFFEMNLAPRNSSVKIS